MDAQIMNMAIFTAVVFAIGIAVWPIVTILDRISLVVSTFEPAPKGLVELKIYWYLVRNQSILREIEQKHANGESKEFIFPLGAQDEDVELAKKGDNKFI